MTDAAKPIGYIVGGGLKEGFRVRLTVKADDVQEGSFVVCESGRFTYYGLATDLQLGATDPRFADEKSDRLPPVIQQALYGKTLHTTLEMYPTLMLDIGPDLMDPAREAWEARVAKGEESPGPKPVKTVPGHHAGVRLAGEGDVAQIFGEDGPNMFVVGHTIEQGYPIRLDLEKFVKRSSGIFGATGTGKSFLTRMVLAGLMQRDVAAALVFDMHNEYAYDSQDSDKENTRVYGLKSMFGTKVQVAALGNGSMVGQKTPDFTLEISMDDFRTSDIMLLSEALNLTDTAASTLAALQRDFNKHWFANFMKLEPGAVVEDSESGKMVPASNSVAYWARNNNVHEKAAEALYGRLRLIADRPYVVTKPGGDPVQAIVEQLEGGRHVILSFGKFDTEMDYLLVSNILTRRIRERWVDKKEQMEQDGQGGAPRPLVIVVEEAHKLLSPHLSSQTAFGTIARELRKYYVTLLIVDQRPSGIDDEVMSQLGTRITGWLGDEDDIRAVLSGLAGRDALRGMLARLQEKEEVLLLGWGVKMPLPIRSRRYDKAFYDEVRRASPAAEPGKSAVQTAKDALF